jgi:3-methyladenine DNA glycosylase AlkD
LKKKKQLLSSVTDNSLKMNEVNQYVLELEKVYLQHGNPANAEGMSRYMKEQFPYYGIKTPQRRALAAAFIAEHGLPEGEALKALCRACFESEYRELHYFVGDALSKRLKTLDVSFLDVFETLIGIHSWWDSVDFLAPKLAGGLFLRFPEQIAPYTDRWIESDNFWYQRAAIIFQLGYKQKTDAQRLFKNVLRRADSKEFFVQKGAGWALREYSKTDPAAVRGFVQGHKLAALTKREALRLMDL